MAFNFSEKTTFTGFTAAEQATILATMQTAYDGSATAKTMFDTWIDAGNIIQISNKSGVFQAYTREDAGTGKIAGTGILELDLSFISDLSYINDTGKPVLHSLLGALVHELGHGLEGKSDDWTETDYQGANVRYVNTIWSELGLDKEISYTAQARNDLHKVGYQYTNGAKIDAARTGNVDMNSAALPGASSDLLIGGPSANRLQSATGNDFLFGAGGNDTLEGGKGKDTAVYFGTELDYDIKKNLDGSWAVNNVRGAKDGGSDTLKNIEVVQFDGGKTYDLKKNGLTFQTDFALVIDTTGSMGSSIGSVKAQASALIDAVFAGGKNDGRIGVVGFKDTTNGEPSQVILPFTDQDDFAARKSAAITAINGITVSGGGDLPETAYDGLRTALNGSMGQWRFGAGALRIALFTDAAAKDGVLAGEVNALAKRIGATITSSSSLASVGGSVDTFSLALTGAETTGAKLFGSDDPNASVDFPFVASDEPIDLDPITSEVQIFTIFTGSPDAGVDTTDLAKAASDNGGTLLAAPTNDELVKKLFEIINAPPVTVTKPTISIANISQSEGNSDPTNYGFNLVLSNPSSETVTVKYATADDTATAGSDYTSATSTVTFNPGETTKIVNVVVAGDTLVETDEAFKLNLSDAVNATIATTSATGTIVNDDVVIPPMVEPVVEHIVVPPVIWISDAHPKFGKEGDPDAAHREFDIYLSHASTETITVEYSTVDGPAIGDEDFEPIAPTTLTFAPGETLKTISVAILDDNVHEDKENFIVELSNATHATIELGYHYGMAKIIDDDLPSISIDCPDDAAYETSSDKPNLGKFTFKRTGSTTDALEVNYTIEGSAINGTDYITVDDSITFAAGSDTSTIEIKPIDDLISEGVETVTFKLDDSDNYTIVGDKSEAVKITELVLDVKNLDKFVTGLQNTSEGELIDFRSFAGQNLKVDTVSVGDAAYQNYIGFYAVEDAQGTLANGLKVGDAGYAEAAIKSAIMRGFKNETQSDLAMTGGKIFAPVVIANGTFEDFLNRNPKNEANGNIHAYFNYLGANTDKVDHFRLLGDNKFGVEDLYGGGDRDYNDIVVQLTVKG